MSFDVSKLNSNVILSGNGNNTSKVTAYVIFENVPPQITAPKLTSYVTHHLAGNAIGIDKLSCYLILELQSIQVKWPAFRVNMPVPNPKEFKHDS